MTLREQQSKFIIFLGKLLLWADQQGIVLTGGELQRTKEQQALYVSQGKSQTMRSKHLDKLAIDLNVFVDGKYQTGGAAYAPLGAYWCSLDPGCVWGGNWTSLKDFVHFQYEEWKPPASNV